MSKVFISSTVFDLLDARAEVERLLREMRLVPVVSGIATSGFQPLPDQNSIETAWRTFDNAMRWSSFSASVMGQA